MKDTITNLLRTVSISFKRVLITVATIVSTILVFYSEEAYADVTLIVWVLCLVKFVEMFDEYWEDRNE